MSQHQFREHHRSAVYHDRLAELTEDAIMQMHHRRHAQMNHEILTDLAENVPESVLPAAELETIKQDALQRADATHVKQAGIIASMGR